MINRVLLFFVLIAHFAFVSGQLQNDLSYPKDEKVQFNKNVTNASLIVVGSVALTLVLDKPVNDWFQNNQTDFGDKLTDVSNFFGEKYFIVPGVGATWGVAHIIKDEKLKRTSWNAMKSIATTALATELFKYSLGRARPFMDEGAYSFHPFSGEDHYKSMPSGHTSLAFAAFTPYAETYSRWIYIVPASVAIARVYKNKHWLSDTVLGAGLGFLSGYIFTHYPSSKVQLSSNGVVVYF
ncbi:phosphatase PAP2 family protein [Carboxylicivirga sp. N1Y90]|uniref:phosphatase PAP2 family protein n=1 Tax=Carboxylicivirga fragile TaxID=3417571 RepID=UPI003D32834C|nr:phosphatase PAP2 family protein [Marinilabiliaceae bacterium N1Y90]